MQRKPTKNTRGPNNDEKQFAAWCKHRPCIVCGSFGVVVHHAMGATYKHNKTLVGHWFLLPLCVDCDNVVTYGSRKKFRQLFGKQGHYFALAHKDYSLHTGRSAPLEVLDAIADCRE